MSQSNNGWEAQEYIPDPKPIMPDWIDQGTGIFYSILTGAPFLFAFSDTPLVAFCIASTYALYTFSEFMNSALWKKNKQRMRA